MANETFSYITSLNASNPVTLSDIVTDGRTAVNLP